MLKIIMKLIKITPKFCPLEITVDILIHLKKNFFFFLQFTFKFFQTKFGSIKYKYV